MDVQSIKPIRREIEQRENYSAYRTELREDFNGSCGYCDDSDHLVDKSCFHIDHFAPKSKFEHLANSYSNLVYSCRFCNNRKRAKWIGNNPEEPYSNDQGFVDPCDPEYSSHLSRNEHGQIIPKTILGQYMVRNLNLNLLRHEILWKARRARELRNEIKEIINIYRTKKEPNKDKLIALLSRYVELNENMERYEHLATGE